MGKIQFRIEPDLQYCPQCHDEYRADILTCAECGIDLVSGARLLEIQAGQGRKEIREITPDDDLADIMKGQILNIKTVQARLREEGIPTIIAGDAGTCGKGCCGGGEVRLQARTADLAEVSRILAREHARSTSLMEHDTTYLEAAYDADAGRAICPACGCSFTTETTTCPDCGLCF